MQRQVVYVLLIDNYTRYSTLGRSYAMGAFQEIVLRWPAFCQTSLPVMPLVRRGISKTVERMTILCQSWLKRLLGWQVAIDRVSDLLHTFIDGDGEDIRPRLVIVGMERRINLKSREGGEDDDEVFIDVKDVVEDLGNEVRAKLAMKLQQRQLPPNGSQGYQYLIEFVDLRSYANALPKSRRRLLTDAIWRILEQEEAERKTPAQTSEV